MEKLDKFNPWHRISYGDEVPEVVNSVIEIPKGSKSKYELDKETGLLKLDRILYSSVMYPANYGFIPQTYCEDEDPLDILVICSQDVIPNCIVEAKVIGAMEMFDSGERDDKIIAVTKEDMSVNFINNIDELPAHTLIEMRRFFEDYKKNENKEVVVENFLHRDKAFKIVNEAIEFYKTQIACTNEVEK